MPQNFADLLTDAIRRRGTCAVVGIDPVYERLPAELQRPAASVTLREAVDGVERFCREVIELVAPRVPAVKINSAFFEAFYASGVEAYYRLIRHAHQQELLVIGDVKRGDIGSTAELYARSHLAAPRFVDVDPAGMPDAVTLAGYLGAGAVRPFIDAARREGKGVFILVRPSDPGADQVHEFPVATAPCEATASRLSHDRPKKFYEHMAELVRAWGDAPDLIGACGYSCVGAVVAPKDAVSTAALREMMPRTLFLVPGYGAQGATAEACRACFKPDGTGAIVNTSRSVIYAFSQPTYAERYAADWRACVTEACRDFVHDLARMLVDLRQPPRASAAPEPRDG